MSGDVRPVDDIDKEGLIMQYEPSSASAYDRGAKKGGLLSVWELPAGQRLQL